MYNLAHLPIIIPSSTTTTTTTITRVAMITERIRTMYTKQIANTTATATTTTAIRSAFAVQNNHRNSNTDCMVGTNALLSNLEPFTTATSSPSSTSTTSNIHGSTFAALDDINGNLGYGARYTTAAAAAAIDANQNHQSGHRMMSSNGRAHRGEIRITENPIAETIVC